MKYFIVLLAVGVVFAQQPFDTSFEDNQQEADKTFDDDLQEIETQYAEDDNSRRPTVIPSTTNLFNCVANEHSLNALINGLIDIKLASQPAVQTLYLSVPTSNRYLTITRLNSATFQLSSAHLDYILIGNGQTAATSTILAYRPRYNLDKHQTGLGAIFLNLDRLFPCIANTDIVPICRRFTQEEDGFFKGKTITEAGDEHTYMIFDTRITKTYGFVFESCPYLNGSNGCLPTYFQTVITCFLPRSCL